MSGVAETSLGIAAGLANEAIWHDGRCNWVGPWPEADGTRPQVVVRSLPPDLYSGTAGVGLVLAEVGAATGDAACRRAGLGALRQSLSRADRVDRAGGLGLFSGLPGIGLAAVRAGLLLGEPELVERGRAVALAVAALRGVPGSDDLVAGRAGAVAALLVVGAALSEPRPVAVAADLGEDLMAAAEARGSWRAPPDATGSGLMSAGLSHGASGAAWALLELWAATGEARCRAAADAAWASEQARFDPAAANWPASREPDGDEDRQTTWASQVAWCHGAPGIGLARHRAWELTGDDSRRSEAAIALGTTARWSRAACRSRRGGYCLCHGLAGNAEVLTDCASAVGDGAAQLRTLADEIARAGIEEYGPPSRPWPCGWPGGESPGLMTGLAGIARFYLRRALPDLPSLLLPRASDDWASPGGVIPPGRGPHRP